VQQCRACNTAVQIYAAAPMPRLQSFAQWLARHAVLVNSLSMSAFGGAWLYSAAIDGLQYEDHNAAAQLTGPIGSFVRLGLATASSPGLVVMYCFD
jgi:hypothetical protein